MHMTSSISRTRISRTRDARGHQRTHASSPTPPRPDPAPTRSIPHPAPASRATCPRHARGTSMPVNEPMPHHVHQRAQPDRQELQSEDRMIVTAVIKIGFCKGRLGHSRMGAEVLTLNAVVGFRQVSRSPALRTPQLRISTPSRPTGRRTTGHRPRRRLHPD